MSDSEQRLDKIEQQLQTIANNQSSDGQRSVYGNQYPSNNDEIDLRELWDVLWSGKWWVIGVTFLFAVAGVFYALSLPNIYQSLIKLAPTEESNSSMLNGEIGGLASLAGINVGGSGGESLYAIEVAKSRDLIRSFVNENNLVPKLMAVKSWDQKNNNLLYDPEKYDKNNNKWVREVEFPKLPEPSFEEVYEVFLSNLLVSQDKKTGFVTIAFEYLSPYVAKDIVEGLVLAVNKKIRLEDIEKAEIRINYLKEEVKKSIFAEVRESLFGLIEEQVKVVMLANVREDYVFQVIDQAYVPEKRHSPSRSIICILFVIVGGFISVITLIIRIAFVRNQSYKRGLK